MKTIRIIDALSNSCLLARELGDRLFEIVQQALETDEYVELDFAGYKYVSPPFIEQSLGRILLEHHWDTAEFERTIRIVNMEEDDREEVELVFNDLMMSVRKQ